MQHCTYLSELIVRKQYEIVASGIYTLCAMLQDYNRFLLLQHAQSMLKAFCKSALQLYASSYVQLSSNFLLVCFCFVVVVVFFCFCKI